MSRKTPIRNIYTRDEKVWNESEQLAKAFDISLSRFVERALVVYNEQMHRIVEKSLESGR